MTRWNNLTAGTRSWVMAFIIVVIVLLILAALGYFSGSWEAQSALR